MRKLAILLALTAFAVMGYTGCGGMDDCCQNEIIEVDLYGTVQGVVVDAITGKQLDDADVMVLLNGDIKHAQGTEGSESQGEGTYYFSRIPCDVEIPIFASATGYQDFEGIIKMDSPFIATEDVQYFLEDPRLLANIQLFPIGYKTPPFQVRVTFQNQGVGGATILMTPTSEGNSGLSAGNYLGAVSNRLQALEGTTGIDGTVVFGAESLVLGGAYKLAVLPIQFSNKFLGRAESDTFIVGTSSTYWEITPTEISPTSTPQTECDDLTYTPTCSLDSTTLTTCSGGYYQNTDCSNNGAVCIEDPTGRCAPITTDCDPECDAGQLCVEGTCMTF